MFTFVLQLHSIYCFLRSGRHLLGVFILPGTILSFLRNFLVEPKIVEFIKIALPVRKYRNHK